MGMSSQYIEMQSPNYSEHVHPYHRSFWSSVFPSVCSIAFHSLRGFRVPQEVPPDPAAFDPSRAQRFHTTKAAWARHGPKDVPGRGRGQPRTGLRMVWALGHGACLYRRPSLVGWRQSLLVTGSKRLYQHRPQTASRRFA